MSTARTDSSDAGRDFCCLYCERTFRRLEHLQRHTRRHTNEKPFSCYCGASFSRRDLLRRHERVSCHAERPGNHHSRVTNGTEQAVLSQSNSPLATTDLRIFQSTTNDTGSLAYQSPHSLSSSTYLEPSFLPVSAVSNQLPSSLSTGQALRSNESPDPYSSIRETSGLSVHGCPTIFPAPQLSLATQIIPHFSCPIVTPSDRSRLLFALEAGDAATASPTSRLPSAKALTRYLAGYFTGFYPHFPFTHAATFKLQSCPPELCLAMMAVGAQDRFEATPAKELFHFSKTLLFAQQQNRSISEANQPQSSSSSNRRTQESQLIDEVRCLLCLAQFVTWQNDASLKAETCILQSLLAQSLRMSGLEETSQTLLYSEWEQWVQWESARRTKLFAFCFLATQSISYDTPPSIWCDEIKLRLPCSCPEWTAPDAVTWNLLQQSTSNEQELLHEALDALLSPMYRSDHSSSSPVANYVLIHALLQKIIWTRRSISGSLSLASSTDYEKIFDTALRRWTSCWQQTPESNLEPLDPNGPLPFTSCALLSLAYIRNCSVAFGSRNISTWAPAEIAEVLRSSRPADRRQSSLFAAYHATNLLATLVNLGVQYFKNNQTVLWGIESTLCGLESSIFLQKWLCVVINTMENTPLTDHETSLIEWIKEVVREGFSSLGDSYSERNTQLSSLPDQAMVIWTQIMQGNSPFPFVKLIGEVLVEYRRTISRDQ